MTRPLSKSCTASTASTASTSLLLHLLLLTTNTTTITYTSAASWETSNDPDSLCLRNSSPQTGYRATLDCRGYVYCNDGYLMGGVIPCWPNQLFDERTDTCASWQGVLEGTVGDGGDMNMRCPLFDGEMMLPDVVDGNANPERFFCGASSSNAKRVCEPCPGGSRLECSDATHNCFAGVTGCPTTPSTTAVSPAANANPSPPSTFGSPPTTATTTATATTTTPLAIISFPTNPPTPLSTNKPPTNKPTVNNNDESNNNGNTNNNDLYLHDYLRSSYYCGYSWEFVIRSCETSLPCDSGLNTQCPSGQTCFPGTPCAELLKQTPNPTKNPTYSPITSQQHSYYCGFDWEWVTLNCHLATPCPGADAMGVCPEGQKCIADTPCNDILNGGPTKRPTPLPTPHPTFPPVQGDDTAKRFCGINWADVTTNCLTATPCPSGDAFGVCPDGMNCIAETPCADEEFLDWLREKQASSNGSGGSSPAVEDTVANYDTNAGNIKVCASDGNCNVGEYCNHGYCGKCSILDETYNMGCSTEQVCKTAGCQVAQEWGVTKCFAVVDLHKECEEITGAIGSTCNTDKMMCEFAAVTVDDNSSSSVVIGGGDDGGSSNVSQEETSNIPSVAMNENPEGNTFFCGKTYYTILEKCLQSKPCPGGFGNGICADDEGCFSVSQCKSEYDVAKTTSPPPSKPPTPSPTKVIISSKSPNTAPTKNPTLPPTSDPSKNPSPAPFASPPTPSTDSNTSQNINPTLSPAVVTTSDTINDPTFSPTAKPEPPQSPITFATKPPTKPPSQTTNYCGVTWSSHAQDCVNSVPCPRGDECPSGQTCFNDSPCAQSNDSDNGNVAESNVRHLCGSEWNVLMAECMSATPCPSGNECGEGEFCYRNFVCDPPLTTTTSSTKPVSDDAGGGFEGATLSTPSSIVAEKGEDNITDKQNNENDVTAEVPTQNEPTNVMNNNIENNQSNPTTSGDYQSNNDPNSILIEPCDICGSAGQIDWAKTVEFNGTDISCGEFGWIFAAGHVYEGSDQCLIMRASYFGSCCFTTPENGCKLCDTGVNGPFYDVRTNVNVDFDGEQMSCAELSNKISTKFEAYSQTCTDSQTNHFSDCCFERCNVCGDSQLDWEATVYRTGENMPCYEFDKIFQQNSVSTGSTDCTLTQDLYKNECCIDPPDVPCNLCQSGSTYYQLNSDVSVSYDGKPHSCLEVYANLFSRRDESSEHCTKAQGELLSQCCDLSTGITMSDPDSIQSNNAGDIQGVADMAPSPSNGRSNYTNAGTTDPPSKKFNSWYAGNISAAATRVFSVVSMSMTIVVIILIA